MSSSESVSEQAALFDQLSVAQQQPPGAALADQLPIAQVVIDSDVPLLDRLFDYQVPQELADLAQPGTRVRVDFSGQKVNGYIRRRIKQSSYTGSFKPLEQVISPLVVVNEQTFELAEMLAQRYASPLANVLRLAIPRRLMSLEQAYLAAPAGQPENPRYPTEADLSAFLSYRGAGQFFADLKAGRPVRAVLPVLPAAAHTSWEDLLARALLAAASQGRGALAVLPDVRDVKKLEFALEQLVTKADFAILTSQQKPAEQYSAFLKVLYGQVSIVIGTRTAAFAPLQNIGLLICWDDGNSNLLERHSPYCHAREILLLRASQHKSSLLLAGYALSTEAARLVRSGWAQLLTAPAELVKEKTPLVRSTGNSFELARDPLAAFARIPQLAFEQARQALERGPVLVQVSRSGYIPSLSCQQCRMPVRCGECRGPVAFSSQQSSPHCRWCGKIIQDWVCPQCQGKSWRIAAAGALRTAEELGRAFPNISVISSSGDHIIDNVSDQPALVVATPGAEPRAAAGYAAALLLDANSMLYRDSLRAPENAVRTWLNAAALVRPRSQGGIVVITAASSPALNALSRWVPAQFAMRELEERAELGLPPAVRTAAITGKEQAVTRFAAMLSLPEQVLLRGPVEVKEFQEGEEEIFRILLFFSYGQAAQVTSELRAVRAATAALKIDAVNIRCDGLDVL